jgi:hypothetical protein
VDDIRAYKHIVSLIRERDALEAEKGIGVSKFNSKIKELDKAISEATVSKPKIPVVCRIAYSWSEGVKRWLRTDTGEVVKIADIDSADMQTDFYKRMIGDLPKQDADDTTGVPDAPEKTQQEQSSGEPVFEVSPEQAATEEPR